MRIPGHPRGDLPLSPKHEPLQRGDYVKVDNTTASQYLGKYGTVQQIHITYYSVYVDGSNGQPVKFLRRELSLIARNNKRI